MPIKHEVRILGIDDGPIISANVVLIGAVFRGAYWLDDALRSEIERDGFDVVEVLSGLQLHQMPHLVHTEKMVELVRSSNRYEQIRAIMLDGITYAGFNIVDLNALHRQTGLPIIAVMRSPPNLKKVKEALKNLDRSEERWNLAQNAGDIHEVTTSYGSVFVQCCGIDLSSATELVQLTSIHSRIPEPLRVAHLIASRIFSKGADISKV
ncbi:MAG: DUF99 family protein [Methanosarcinales archaeon Met12]|nr:MAG: DUF99 family protein [Methanosarcinales archaeon Met12]